MIGHTDPEKFARIAFADGPRLLADIGATHARFALQTAPGIFRSVRVLKCDDFEGIVPLLQFYLADDDRAPLHHAALAVANPVNGDQVRMTNRDCEFSTDAVRFPLPVDAISNRPATLRPMPNQASAPSFSENSSQPQMAISKGELSTSGYTSATGACS